MRGGISHCLEQFVCACFQSAKNNFVKKICMFEYVYVKVSLMSVKKMFKIFIITFSSPNMHLMWCSWRNQVVEKVMYVQQLMHFVLFVSMYFFQLSISLDYFFWFLTCWYNITLHYVFQDFSSFRGHRSNVFHH